MRKEEIIQDILKGMEGIGGIPSNHEFYAEFDFRLRSALGIESENERLKADREWISVEDRLPENDDDVLVCLRDEEIKVDWYDNQRQYWMRRDTQVTHWMPLPRPPKE